MPGRPTNAVVASSKPVPTDDPPRSIMTDLTDPTRLGARPDEAPLPVPRSDCSCRQCVRARDAQDGGVESGLGFRMPTELTRMILCPICGNKRCPHANDHRLACTGSNEPGQPGSAYP